MSRFPDTLLTRREVIALGVGALTAASVPWWRHRVRLVRRSIPVMGTIAEVAVAHRDVGVAQAAIDAAFNELRLVDALMSRFNPQSDIGQVNRSAGRRGVTVDPVTAEVVEAGLAWAAWTDGQFDPCLGRAMELWDIEHSTTPPDASAFRRFGGRRLFEHIDVERKRNGALIALRDADAAIDLGGIGKGYAVDRAADAVRTLGIEHALINAGGDLAAVGASPDGSPWKIGIRSPRSADEMAATVEVVDAAVATSGDYLQFFEHGGRRYHHLLDPVTGSPRTTAMRSLTVKAERCVDADAGATAGFGLPEARARALATFGRAGEVVHSL